MKGKDDMYRYQIQIGDGSLKTRKASGNYKDYGRDTTLWSKAFLNYSSILFSFFSTTSSGLYLALANFHREIVDLGRIYQWQGGVLPLAIDLHTRIVEGYPKDPTRWEIAPKWQARFCNPMTILAIHPDPKRKHENSPSTSANASRSSQDAKRFFGHLHVIQQRQLYKGKLSSQARVWQLWTEGPRGQNLQKKVTAGTNHQWRFGVGGYNEVVLGIQWSCTR